ncbi:TPA: oligoribonuclease [Pseudomonas aeruginosa]|uniref:oligoribonuclease n=1 Tax=Pseudomonas aeruginosa TaxID=287 RepID=UPI0015BAE079|nr:oligoribonuclease [Pseudomonas aeruginosa]EKF7417509.1 oligoribonuclease [Pseudomonas aeruginosa]HCA5864591.1 oligoribonuclease [Pseudomonas aeruginosa]HCA7380110.1 oligoribonuclease [Pseudomonas aeruginosa]HCA7773079.1 oligoribonuclease [Pseudomonas aeruginosa]
MSIIRLPSERRLAWIDLETTGYTELHRQLIYKQLILEIGVLVTDDDFNVVAQHNIVVRHPVDEAIALCDENVRQMHTDNGLFGEVDKAATDLKAAEQQVIAFLIDNGVEPGKSPLCGNGIHFDRMFMEAQLPELNAYLHYRNLDISAVKEFIKTLSSDFEPPKRRSHRALDDILESVQEARTYRDLIAPALHALSRSRERSN